MGGSRGYKEQLERVKRWYERFREINEGREHSQSSEYYQDEIYAFFQSCYHLKDWIKNDLSVGFAADIVEGFVEGNDALKLCADICNSTKHLRLTRSRSLKDPAFGKREFDLELHEPGRGHPPIIRVKCEIDTRDGPIDAFELATRCVQAWEGFISSKIHS